MTGEAELAVTFSSKATANRSGASSPLPSRCCLETPLSRWRRLAFQCGEFPARKNCCDDAKGSSAAFINFFFHRGSPQGFAAEEGDDRLHGFCVLGKRGISMTEASTLADYSRKTMGLVRALLNEKAQVFAHMTSKIVAYWKPKLFDIGLQIDVINAMSSHSFYWTSIIPVLLEGKLENNYGYGPPLSAIDQADAVDKLVKFLLNSLPPQSSAGRELRESLNADGFILSTGATADSKIPEELSKLPNADAMRAALAEQLKAELVALLFIDLDNFKSVNDHLVSHAEGDKCLVRAVKAISAAIIHKGKLYRRSGDEFIVVLPNFDSREATAVAERIRIAIDDAKPGGAVNVTASIGVATSQSDGVTDAASLEKLADNKMYEARETKNRVVSCDH